jgi:hypothetical protein
MTRRLVATALLAGSLCLLATNAFATHDEALSRRLDLRLLSQRGGETDL